jgi:2-deoxy-D-gluconate 3-dehydrogenase
MILDQFRLDGKVALVTGAARGLGQAMALGLAEAGADIVALGRRDCDETVDLVSRLGRRCCQQRLDLREAAVTDLQGSHGPVGHSGEQRRHHPPHARDRL